VSAPLEGARRPTHFRGVCTVVLKLFHITQPDRAYFGQKDAQQLAVIQRMVRDLDVPVVVRACPTVREPDGLAMSSRNAYLAPAERAAAPALYRALQVARQLLAGGERHAARLKTAMSATLGAEPLVEEDYVAVADPDSMAELDTVTDGALFAIAARIGRTRLIDNLLVGAAPIESASPTGEN
jgi:pantoate--beta-alanine ligase